MTRKEVRSHSFRILFQLKFFKVPQVLEKIDLYWNTQEVEEGKARDDIMEFVSGVTQNLDEIDKTINNFMKGWKTTRIPSADLAILRIAVYEMLYTDLSIKIIANEAVELAKTYSTDDSPSFVNAIIGQIHKGL
ncbi:MAG: transcription antitermination factor NusB [Clostridia bacterium]|nr:transcription antitermination factor NusB [Clostridia bacterium]